METWCNFYTWDWPHILNYSQNYEFLSGMSENKIKEKKRLRLPCIREILPVKVRPWFKFGNSQACSTLFLIPTWSLWIFFNRLYNLQVGLLKVIWAIAPKGVRTELLKPNAKQELNRNVVNILMIYIPHVLDGGNRVHSLLIPLFEQANNQNP